VLARKLLLQLGNPPSERSVGSLCRSKAAAVFPKGCCCQRQNTVAWMQYSSHTSNTGTRSRRWRRTTASLSSGANRRRCLALFALSLHEKTNPLEERSLFRLRQNTLPNRWCEFGIIAPTTGTVSPHTHTHYPGTALQVRRPRHDDRTLGSGPYGNGERSAHF